MNAQLKEIAYGAAYNAFLNAHKMDRAGLNENQIKILNWLEPSMADAYATAMIHFKRDREESLKLVYEIYKVENLVKIFQAIESGEIEEILGQANC